MYVRTCMHACNYSSLSHACMYMYVYVHTAKHAKTKHMHTKQTCIHSKPAYIYIHDVHVVYVQYTVHVSESVKTTKLENIIEGRTNCAAQLKKQMFRLPNLSLDTTFKCFFKDETEELH